MKPLSFPRLLTILLLAAALLGPSALPARADVAPPPPPFASSLSTDSVNTNVQMVSENVLMDVSGVDNLNINPAWVTASFLMHNTGSQDENLKVRFPLYGDYDGQCADSPYPPITSFGVYLNKNTKSLNYDLVDQEVNSLSGGKKTLECWAVFPVTFPAGKDVEIFVHYFARGYVMYEGSGTELFTYVLRSGAGWFGPIGSAEVALQYPYPITPENSFECRVGNDLCQLEGNRLVWRGQNFEPDQDFYAHVVTANTWKNIQTEIKNTTTNPGDGEAWGRLGRYYKMSILEKRGYRMDEAAPGLFFKSKAAYEKALQLLNSDVDWHYGYAELVCNAAFWPQPGFGTSSENWVTCLNEIRIVLALKPDYAGALDILSGASGLGLVDTSSGKPVYTGLTTTPTAWAFDTLAPTETPTPTGTTVLTPTATTEVSPTPQPSDTFEPTVTSTPTQFETTEVIAQPPTQTTQPQTPPTAVSARGVTGLPLCGGTGALFLLVGLFALWWKMK